MNRRVLLYYLCCHLFLFPSVSNPLLYLVASASPQVFPGQPYKDMDNTAFADLLRRGCLAVVKSGYFAKCFSDGVPFQDRANIPEEWFIHGDELMKAWQEHGAKFLVIISYPWLSKAHPDPKMFHLRRLTFVLKQLETYHNRQNLGVIMDFCALWQKHGESETRTEFQIKQFKDGLKEINTPYGHQEITSIKMIKVPDSASWLDSC